MTPKIRAFEESDRNFITNSYLKTMRYRHPFADMADNVYFPAQRKELEIMLKASDVLVACNPEDPGHVFGYVLSEKFHTSTVVHFIYVKHAVRKFGIAKMLFDLVAQHQSTTLVTHVTQTNFSRLATKYGLVYDPYLLRGLSCN